MPSSKNDEINTSTEEAKFGDTAVRSNLANTTKQDISVVRADGVGGGGPLI